jgi:glucan 1,3-beta-glucosidase
MPAGTLELIPRSLFVAFRSVSRSIFPHFSAAPLAAVPPFAAPRPGSWFTLEKWITPQPFTNAKNGGDADYDIAASDRSADDKRRALEHHWDSWLTEADFGWLASRGINTVRLPISFYHLAGLDRSLLKGTEFEPFADVYQGAWERIERAFGWADRHGLGVLVDLHAVPGKQNEDAHSGASHHGSELFDKRKCQEQTVRVLEALVGAICQVDNVVGCVWP